MMTKFLPLPVTSWTIPSFSLLPVILVAAVCLGSASCATLLNRETQNIRIRTGKNITHVSIDHSLTVDSFSIGDDRSTNTFDIRRSRKPLLIHMQLDSAGRSCLLRARSSFAYWININCNYGIGMLVDRKNDKRFGYPGHNYFYAKDTLIYWQRFAPIPRGTVRFSLGLPLINELSLRSPDGQLHTVVAGLEAGLDYFYKEDRYLSFSVGGASTLEPDKRSIPVEGTIRSGAGFYTSIKANRVLGSFDIGYGIALSGMEPLRNDYLHDSIANHASPTNFALGLSFSVQYRIGNTFRIGAFYQPSLWSPSLSPVFRYQHYLGIGLAWKFPGE